LFVSGQIASAADADGWAIFNPIYAEFFGTHKPARAIGPTAAFPRGFKVEVDAIAVLNP
jgi:2-iminobutanoate/2-iminopropanoate deaminase